MGFLQGFIISVSLSFILLAKASAAIPIRVFNSANDFKKLVAEAEGDPATRLDAWSKFETKYSEIYDKVVFRKGSKRWEEERVRKLNRFFDEIPKLKEPIFNLLDSAEITAQTQADQFHKIFPDLKSDIPVVFVPSIFSFNGKGIYLKSYQRNTLLVGVDFVAQRKDDLDTLFAHEFFHVYHFDLLDPKKIWQTMASPLWFEGFATFVSSELNPGKDDASLLMDKDLADKCADAKLVAEWARDYQKIVDEKMAGPAGEAFYNNWFTISTPSHPKRKGYCLGLAVFRKLSKTYTIGEMSKWPEERFSRETRNILVSLAN